MKWPDFLIIGGHKCGTTQLFLDLNKHPNITMCRWTPIAPESGYGGTEMHFWSGKNWDRGIKEYRKAFDGNISGEKSPSYWSSNKAMRRIHGHIPNVKLILCVRNPIDRAYSHFHSFKRRGMTRSFDKNNKSYLKGGMYYTGIKSNILPYFNESQIYVVVGEWMKEDPNRELAKVHEFLGDDYFELPVERVDVSKGWVKGKTNLYEDQFKGKYTVWENNYAVPKDVRKNLLKVFKPHNEKLFDFLGYRIDEWGE